MAIDTTLPRPLLDRPTAAALLGIRPRTLRQWTDDGRVPCVRQGARVLYCPDLIDRLRIEGVPRLGGPSS